MELEEPKPQMKDDLCQEPEEAEGREQQEVEFRPQTESFSIETPSGFTISTTSAYLRADALAGLCMGVFNDLKESVNGRTNKSYTA